MTRASSIARRHRAVPGGLHLGCRSAQAAGRLHRTGSGVRAQPGRRSGHPDAHRQKDADYFSADPALARAYHRVTLTDLDGSGTLTGAYAKVISETGKAAADTGSGFVYTRDQDQFEQTMGYYWVTQAQRYIQSLGFGSTLPAVNKRQQLLRINQFGGDNSFYREGTGKLTITFGKGGVDDAEDAEVIVHEYGHSVQDNQVPGFGTTPDAAPSARPSATTWP